MMTLNLIPSTDKQELRLLHIYLAIKNVIALLLLGVIAIALGLIVAKIFLQNYFTYLVRANTLLQLNVAKGEGAEIRTFRKHLVDAQQIQVNYVPWSQLLLALSQETPPGITLTDLEVNAQGQGELSGIAARRADLLEYRERLIRSNLVQEFSLPFALQLQQAQVNFRLPIQFNLPKLSVELP